MPIQEKCRVLDQQPAGPNYFKLTLFSPYISSHAEPGQFINVRCSASYEPLLRRPISLHRIQAEHKSFELLYEVKGKGTALLSNLSVGEEVDVLGPLGSGFKVDPAKKIHVLVGGGMGIAPLLALAEQITKDSRLKTHTHAPYALIGAKSKKCVTCENEFRKITDQILTATDDGSYGKKGLVSDVLLDVIENTIGTGDWGLTALYACGPKPMLKAIAEIAWQKKIDCQVSLEERMACGIGACKGCAVKTRTGYKMACADGPVFDAKELVW